MAYFQNLVGTGWIHSFVSMFLDWFLGDDWSSTYFIDSSLDFYEFLAVVFLIFFIIAFSVFVFRVLYFLVVGLINLFTFRSM